MCNRSFLNQGCIGKFDAGRIKLFTHASCKITKGHKIVADSEDTFSTGGQVAELFAKYST